MKPYLDILKLVWPLALGMANNALLEFTDRAFLANESLASLEAVLPASMLAMIALGFFQSVVAYSGTFVAQYRGAGDRRASVASYRAGLSLALLSGLVLLALVPFGGFVFESFANGPEVLARQKTYYAICTGGGVFLFGQMAVQSYFTAIGRTRVIFAVNVLGNAVNVLLDWIMVFGHWGCPALGIAGAGYATVLATAVQWAVLAAAAHRDIASSGVGWRVTRQTVSLAGRILRYGVPAGAYSVLNLLSFTIFVFFTGRVGHVEAAVSNACFSINYLLIAPMEGFALGASTLVAQAQGRGDADEAARAGRRTLALALALVAVACALVLAFRRPILAIFSTGAGADAAAFLSLGSTLLVLMAVWELFDAADVVVAGALKGAGDTTFVMWWMLVSAFVLWLPLVWAVAHWHNTMPYLWGTMIVYVAVACAGTLARWYNGRWKRIKLV